MFSNIFRHRGSGVGLVAEACHARQAFWLIHRHLFEDCPYSPATRDIVLEELDYFYHFYITVGVDFEEDDFDYINECEYTDDLFILFDAIDRDVIRHWVTPNLIESVRVVDNNGMFIIHLYPHK